MKQDRNIAWAIVTGCFIGLGLLIMFGCSYGTYNATGSYSNQDNHKTDNCAAQKG